MKVVQDVLGGNCASTRWDGHYNQPRIPDLDMTAAEGIAGSEARLGAVAVERGGWPKHNLRLVSKLLFWAASFCILQKERE